MAKVDGILVGEDAIVYPIKAVFVSDNRDDAYFGGFSPFFGGAQSSEGAFAGARPTGDAASGSPPASRES